MAGYERQNAQTHYLAEYGVLGAMQNLSPDYAPTWLGYALCGLNGAIETCNSNPWIAADPSASSMGKSCHRWSSAQAVTSQYIPSSLVPLDPADAGVAGSLGITNMVGDFNVELTEVAQGPPVTGTSAAGNQYFYWVTLQSVGKTQQALQGNNYTAYYGSEGDEQLRSRVQVGPIPQVGCGAQ
jgi:hypothetical protein